MSTVHFRAEIGAEPFPHCATTVRLTTELDGSEATAILCFESGAFSAQTYPSSTELRAMAAGFITAADRADELAQAAFARLVEKQP